MSDHPAITEDKTYKKRIETVVQRWAQGEREKRRNESEHEEEYDRESG